MRVRITKNGIRSKFSEQIGLLLCSSQVAKSNRFARTEIIVDGLRETMRHPRPRVRQEFVKITVLVAAARNHYRILRTPLYLTNASPPPLARYGRAAFPLAKHNGRGM